MNIPVDVSDLELKTPRLILRPWRESDLSDLFAYAGVDGVGQMAGWMPHKDLLESERILSMFINGKKVLALEYMGKVIGSLGIEEYNTAHYPELEALQGREIGYVLGKDYWGMGLMPEAVKEIVRYLFEDVGLDFILVGHFPRNRQSARVIEKCGFQYIRTTRFETSYDTVEDSVEYIRYNPNRATKRINITG